ncbi:MAG: hypothetical protein P8100_03635 [bacterium]
MLRPVVIVLFFLFLSGCVKVGFYRNYSLKVDSLSDALEEMAGNYKALDSAAIVNAYDSLGKYLDSLSRFQDTIIDSLVISNKYSDKEYKTFWRDHPLILSEIDYSRDQLHDLKHDIDHYQLDKALIKAYFAQEAASVKKLKERIDLNRNKILNYMQQNREFTPKIIDLLDSLNRNKKNEK